MSSVSQTRRFECVLENFQSIQTISALLATDLEVSFLKWSEDSIYIETKNRKVLTYFTKRYNLLANIRLLFTASSIGEKNLKGQHGTPMKTRYVLPEKPGQTTPDKLKVLFHYVRDAKETPDLSEDITAIVNCGDFNKVITAAKMKNMAEDYSLILRPWQKKVVQELSFQGDRQVLWVFDFDGGSGKSELVEYLELKLNYQLLPPGKFTLTLLLLITLVILLSLK